ncbi:MAG TPA: OmpA family protein [Acetobacteraceae bacterium]|nr:OmpA family protein [Acetobacteraceae bacterium]
MRAFVLSLLAAPLALATVPALAQNAPSASQIIDSLKPHGNLTAGGTRGIRLVAPGQSAAQPVAMSQVPARMNSGTHMAHHASVASGASASAPSVNLTVDFATGSAELTPQARQTLDQLGKALSSQDLGKYRFRIEGHTDTVGSAATNLTLSQQRAQAVAAYLESTYGIAPARLQPIGMGEQGLLVPTPPQTPDARNRRVEVINLGA